MSSRKSRPKATNRKDLKHLKEFGEAHPADIAGAQRKLEIENAKAEGTYKRSIIRAKAPKGLDGLLGTKRRKVEEEEIEEKSRSSSESDGELEFDDRVGRDELFELLKRKEEDADESDEEAEITDDEVDEDPDDDEVVEAENTWDTHLNAELTAKQIESISNKKHTRQAKFR